MRPGTWCARISCSLLFTLGLLLVGQAQATPLYTDQLVDWGHIDPANTGALVDTVQHQIRLPTLPSTIVFRPGGSSYYVVTPGEIDGWDYTGSGMALSTRATAPGLDPLAVAFTDSGTMVAAAQDQWQALQWTGQAWMSNPYSGASGLSSVLSLATGSGTLSAETAAGMLTWRTGAGPATADTTMGLPDVAFAAALDPGTGAVVRVVRDATDNRLVAYNYTGSALVQNPYATVSGLTDPRGVACGPDGCYVIDGTHITAVHRTASGVATAVVSGIALNQATAIAVNPQTGDIAVVDGGTVHYYTRNPGGTFTESAAHEAPVSGIPAYSPVRQAQSVLTTAASQVPAIRITAAATLPINTSIAWSVTADGKTWTPATLGSWTMLPQAAWGTSVGWRAVLQNTDMQRTPVIGAPITVEVDSPPSVTNLSLTPQTGAYVSSLTPTANWTFTDPDTGDYQSGKQILVFNRDTGALIYNSGKISTLTTPAPPPDYAGAGTVAGNPDGGTSLFQVPGGVLSSAGTYHFTVQVRVWDMADLNSPWAALSFDLLALGNVRVTTITNPPPGQPTPPPAITNLPVAVRAGANWSTAVDVVGPQGTTVAGTMTVGAGASSPVTWAAGTAPAWTTSTYTAATVPNGSAVMFTITASAPDGTVVTLPVQVATIQGSVLSNWVVVNVR